MTNPQSVDEGKVDVLAVMDACIAKRDLNLADMEKARAAVAELIDAAKSLTQWCDWATHNGCHFGECKTCRLEKVLARIGATP